MSIIDSLSESLTSACGLPALTPDPDAATGLFNWMEHSAVGRCVAETPSGFYILLGFHGMGLAIVVGIMMVVCFRLLNIIGDIKAEALPKLTAIGWVGFWVNAVSGLGLFFGEANKMVNNWPFLLKIALIAVGMTITSVISRTILMPAAAGDTARLSSPNARFLAYFSLLIWVGVIAAGRLIAFLGLPTT